MFSLNAILVLLAILFLALSTAGVGAGRVSLLSAGMLCWPLCQVRPAPAPLGPK